MIRTSLLISLAVAIVAVMALWLVFGGSEKLDARFAIEDCRKLSVRDEESGKLLEGVEDMLFLADGDTLVLSAFDRADQTRPFSGLFKVSRLDIEQGGDEVTATAFVESYRMRGGVRPHGITLDVPGKRLAFVNRVEPDERIVIDVLSWADGPVEPVERHEHEAFCRANDLVYDLEGNLLITRDRAQCGLSVIDVIPFNPTGILLTLTPDGELRAGEERYYFPNGIAIGPTGRPIIAETRAARLSGAYVDMILPGGPDNLTVDDEGALIVALHPSLWQTYLYINGFAFSSSSRVIRADPERTDIEVLYDDPGGRLISAVSVGLMHEGQLYMGSPIDEGIAICSQP